MNRKSDEKDKSKNGSTEALIHSTNAKDSLQQLGFNESVCITYML